MNSTQLAFMRILRGENQFKLAIFLISIIQFSVLLAGALIPRVESEAVSQSIENTSADIRWFTVNLADGTNLGQLNISNAVSENLKKISKIEPRHSIIYRPISDEFAGRFQILGTDQIAQEFTLTSGRFPKSCDEENCEVLLANPQSLTKLPNNLTVVGQGTLISNSPINASIEKETALIVISKAVNSTLLPTVKGYPASEIWSVTTDPLEIQKVGLTTYLDEIQKVSSDLVQINSRLLVSGPINLLETTKNQTEILTNRIFSLVFAIGLIALVAIFYVAASSEKSSTKFFSAIQMLSARRNSSRAFWINLAFWPVVIGTLVSFMAASIIGILLTQKIYFSALSLAIMFVFSLSSVAVIFAALNRSIKVAFLNTIFLAVVLILFINISNLTLSFVIIPIASIGFVILFNFVSGKILISKFLKNTYLSMQKQFFAIGVISSLTISTLISAFIYLDSLTLNVKDNAAFQSPTLTRIKAGGEAQPMQFNSFTDYQNLNNGEKIFGITKISTIFSENLVSSAPVQLVGVDPKVWEFVPDLKHQTGIDLNYSKTVLPQGASNWGVEIAPNATFSTDVIGLDQNTNLGMWILNDRDESLLVELKTNDAKFEAQVPSNAVKVIGFQITENPDYKARREHAVGEGKNALPAPQGKLTFENSKINSQVSTIIKIQNLEYSLLNGPVLISLVEAPKNIPALIDPATAKQIIDQNFQLKVTGGVVIQLKEVAVATQLPTVPMRFALVEPNSLKQFLASQAPSLLRTSEVWLTSDVRLNDKNYGKLTGLTILNQNQLQEQMLSPTNAKWSRYALYLVISLAAILFTLIYTFLLKEIVSNKQLAAWKNTGIDSVQIKKSLNNFVSVFSVLAGTIALVFTGSTIKQFIIRNKYDINGSIAYPGLVAKPDFYIFLVPEIAFIFLILVLTLLSAKKYFLVKPKNVN